MVMLDLSSVEHYRIYLDACKQLRIPLPENFDCPLCGARRGQRCRRPSEHTAFSGVHHVERVALAGGPELSNEEFGRVREWLRQRGYGLPDREPVQPAESKQLRLTL